MDALIRIFGFPHEALHLLALILIGRRAIKFTRTHVEIPDDLTTRQYVFVAGLPAFVFGLITLVGVLGLLNARSFADAVLPLVVVLVGGLALGGTTGDIQLIAYRLSQR
jgi:hypothetical protein